MQVDIAFEVAEVAFEQFERRKAPRENISLVTVKNKAFLSNLFDGTKEQSSEFPVGIEVNEVPFAHFERRKEPR